ncbi:MAG: exodeoxyribonuclease VII large subunit [Atopobiaceae bacterium]|nr:exodeoxyribonuclease VII large subunit [Atopobiaceae bacterium]
MTDRLSVDGGEEASLSVSDAVALAKLTVSRIPTLVVVGELTGWHGPNRTGHCYFSVKDESSSMDVIIWRGVFSSLDEQVRAALSDGLLVQLRGSFVVYDKTGKLSFVARGVSVAGEGLLRQRVAELARKLQAEGLLSDARKRPIPAFCTRVAVVTSPTGKVIDDVKRTLARRNPLVEVLVAGCAVQGDAAPPTIVHALALAASAHPDCILLVRGGGSYEELMAFNDEGVARAVAASPVPVVTGIGHEPDVTICDMVADRRASTPTAAAEGVAPTIGEIIDKNNSRAARLDAALAKTVDAMRHEVDGLAHRASGAMTSRVSRERAVLDQVGRHRCLTDPTWIVSDRRSSLLMTEQRLVDALPRLIASRRDDANRLGDRLCASLPRMVAGHELAVRSLAGRIVAVAPHITQPHAAFVGRSAAALDALSPLKVLGRGYSIVRDEKGHVVASSSSVSVGDDIEVMLGDGRIDAKVTGVR